MSGLPKGAGVSLKPQHFQDIIDHTPAVDFFEIHAENYMSSGGPHLTYLEKIREQYPLSVHGVGLSLGSAEGVSAAHLAELKKLVARFQPTQVSEHLAWSQWQTTFINDLLPLPYSEEALHTLTQNINKTQDVLQRSILVENPSAYLQFDKQKYSEPEFLNTLCKSTGCGLLLDLNNIVVSAFNMGFDALDYLKQIDLQYVGEVHLAGHKETPLLADKNLKIDDHGSAVSEAVWDLLTTLIQRNQAALPLLIEWDTDVPQLDVLLAEARKAKKIMQATLISHSLNRVCRC